MNVYMTEEEQIEAIKKWWKKYGSFLLSAILVVMLIITGTKWWQQRLQGIQQSASISYQQLMDAVAKKDVSAIEATANYLKTNFSDSVYAAGASLLQAKLAVEKQQYKRAISALQWVVQNDSRTTFKQLATIRLARIYKQQKQFALARKTLDEFNTKAFASLVHELQGDILLAEGKPQDAKLQYSQALRASPPQSSPMLEMKLQALQGTAHRVVRQQVAKQKVTKLS